MHPSLYAIPVEGFAFIEGTLALLLREGHLAEHIARAGLDAEFFYHTRPAMIWLLAAAASLEPALYYTDLAPIAGGLILLATLYCAGAFATHGLAIPALAVLSMPILFEMSYFANANIYACICALTGIGLIRRSRGLMAAAVAGALLSAALLFRIDHMLSGALGFAAVLATARDWREAFWRAVALGAGAAGLQGGFYLAESAAGLAASHLPMRIGIASLVLELWDNEPSPLSGVKQLAFTMAPAAILALIGYSSLAKQWLQEFHAFKTPQYIGGVLFFFVFPALFYSATYSSYFDGRTFTVFAPVVLLCIVRGADTIVATLRQDSQPHRVRALAGAAAALTAALVLVPTSSLSTVYEREAPRVSLTGRVWELPRWHSWMLGRGNMLLFQLRNAEAILSRTNDTVLLVSNGWNSEHASDHALARQGFHRIGAARAGSESSPCAVADHWSDGTRSVLHLPLHVPFVKDSPRAFTAYALLSDAGACIASFAAERRWFVSAPLTTYYFPEIKPMLGLSDRNGPIPIDDALLAYMGELAVST
ncbi:MAG: hypothetical protein AAGI34_06860, partial [Pseudomonadota bacterium]